MLNYNSTLSIIRQVEIVIYCVMMKRLGKDNVYMRNTYLEVNLSAFQRNISYLREYSRKQVMAIVKADAYGVGVQAAHAAAKEIGVTAFGVATIEEGVELRHLDADCFIQILGPIEIEDIALAKQYNLCIVTTGLHIFDEVNDLTGVQVCLKVDTGMHRIGLAPAQVSEMCKVLHEKGANIQAILTHYAKSDETDLSFTQQQYASFCEVLQNNPENWRMISTCNSDATLSFHDEVSNYVRCGIGMWGYSAKRVGLQPTCSLYTHVSYTKKVARGEGVSYGGHFVSDGQGYILTLPIGYADGIARNYSGNCVYIAGEYAPIVGSICMDQMMIHTQKDYPVGTKVEIFGEHISLCKMAEALCTIPYEIMVGIAPRVRRRYLKDGEIKETIPRFRSFFNEIAAKTAE